MKFKTLLFLSIITLLLIGCHNKIGHRYTMRKSRGASFIGGKSKSYSPSYSNANSYSMNTSNNAYMASYEPDITAGTLTAGEIHDFGKWELWKDISENTLSEYQKTWKMNPTGRYTLQLTTKTNRPVIDAKVELIDHKNNIIWTSHTDNTGKAELWADIFTANTEKDYSINIRYNKNKYQIDNAIPFNKGINLLKIDEPCNISNQLDVLFMVDATGSMQDEIDYLKVELKDIINKIKNDNANLNINLGSLFYRCIGNSYTTIKSGFSTDIDKTIGFINEQNAGEGGIEAVEVALNEAMDNYKWSENALARLLFIVLDEPPSSDSLIVLQMKKAIDKASEKGIRIIPIVASGTSYNIDKSLEYLMRCSALATNGTYVFLTNHSGIGGNHTDPATDEFDVELLNSLILRIFHKFTYTLPCDKQIFEEESSINDTTYVFNPQIIAHVVLDSSKISASIQPEYYIEKYITDTLIKDTLNNPVSFIEDSTQTEPLIEEKEFHFLKFYPNPTENKITIEVNGEVKDLFIADITGKLLQKIDIQDQSRIEVYLEQYPTGIYFIQYLLDEEWLAGKVILKRN